MPFGLAAGDGGTMAPTDLPGFGEIQWESMAGRDMSRAMVGGDAFQADAAGLDNQGFTRIATGDVPTQPVPGQAASKITDWRMAFNPSGPTMWIMIFTLAAVGLIHARVNLKAGPAAVAGGV